MKERVYATKNGNPPMAYLLTLYTTRSSYRRRRLWRRRSHPPQKQHRNKSCRRQRSSPCRRLSTLIRPSQPTRHRCPRRNQRCRSYARRAGDFGPRRGNITRRTPRSIAACSLPADANPRSPAARSGAWPKMVSWRSSAAVHNVTSAGRVGCTSYPVMI